MADVIIPSKRKILLLKIQPTAETDAAPTNTANAVLASNFDYKVEADEVERPIDRPYFGAFEKKKTNVRATMSFDFEMIGAAAAGDAAPIGPLLRASGHSQTLSAGVSATYAPVSSSFEACTIWFQVIDPNDLTKTRTHAILDAQGTIEWDFSIGSFSKGKATFTGIFVTPPASATLAEPTLTAFQNPPVITKATFLCTLDSSEINVRSIKLKQGASISFHEGSKSKRIITDDRIATGSITAYDPGSFKDIFALAGANATVPMSFSVTGAAGAIVTCTLPKVDLMFPSFADINKAQGLEIPFSACPSSGNDEYSFAFT